MDIDRSQSPDVIERIGIVIWKIAVLVIGLGCTLALIPQQGLLNGLVLGSSLLQGGALVLISVGGVWALIRSAKARISWLHRPSSRPALRSVRHRIPDKVTPQPLTAAQSLQQIMWRGSNWMLALGLESMLGAQIIQVAIAYAGQNDLNWWRMSVVLIIAISRILV